MDENRIDVAEVLSTSKSAAGKPKRAARVSEIETLRAANCKVFRMDDGSEQAVFCSGMTHERSDADSPLELDADGKHYRKRSGSFTAAFSCDENNDELFSMERDTYRIAISAAKNNGQRNAGKIPTLCNKAILFENVAENTDMEYSIVPGGVKENILVKQQANAYRYPFVIHCENVSVESDSTAKQVKFVSSETSEEVFFIPAPFMIDANGIVSTDVNYELENLSDGNIQLTVVADSNWINAQGRAFPVTIDPQVMVSGSTNINTYSWVDGTMTAPAEHTVGKVAVTDPDTGEVSYTTNRMYLHFNMPELPYNPRIKKAELMLYQKSGVNEAEITPKLGIFQITENIIEGVAPPIQSSKLIDYEPMKTTSEDGELVSYVFDITKLSDEVANGAASYQNFVIELLDEGISNNSNVILFGSSDTEYAPTVCITYESSYGINTVYRAHTHELGRFGQGSIDLSCGNLMFECLDFAWAGNRMPVTLKHLYNSALRLTCYTGNSSAKLETANFSTMKLGLGWKLNIMQSMMPVSFQHEGQMYDGYVYIGENGDAIYFKQCDEEENTFQAVTDEDLIYNDLNRTLMQDEETYQFDTSGRLISIADKYSQMEITYTYDRITSVTDGVGRAFVFEYNSDGQLVSITAPDGSTIRYAYFNDKLNNISYPNGTKASIGWASNKPVGIILMDAENNTVYRVGYSFSGNRVIRVSEHGANGMAGKMSTYQYSASARKTIVQSTEAADDGETAASVITTVYTFDHDGNIKGQYVYTTDRGCVGAENEGNGIHPYFGANGVSTISMSNNLLAHHGFDNTRGWENVGSIEDGVAATAIANPTLAKFGGQCICIESTNGDNSEVGVFTTQNNLTAGAYTFSAYMRPLSIADNTEGKGAYLRVIDAFGNVLAESEKLTGYDSDYVRMAVTFDLSVATSVNVQILMDGAGKMYVDAAQLESNPYATAYNLLEAGNFNNMSQYWFLSDGAEFSTEAFFSEGRSMKMTGDLDSVRNARQNVSVKQTRSTRETFTLSGWARGCAIPNRERDECADAQFRLRAVIHYDDSDYEDTNAETFTADFSPCTEDWQYASVQFSKSKYRKVSRVEVFCDFDYNYGTVYFDDIQLVRDSLETGLTAEDFVSADDEIDVAAEEVETENENPYASPTFEELVDSFGNTLTETTYTDGEFGTIYRSFGYGENGNDLIRETDARGNVTTYTVDPLTSRNQSVTDRCGNQTHFEYDAVGRTIKVTGKDAQGAEIANVSYTYDSFDNLTGIVRGDGMKYALQYNEFHNLASIGVDGKTEQLVNYAYKTGNGRLKQISYANGDTMKATYNSLGQMVAEKWFNADGNLTAHYKYGYDGQGNVVRSVDMLFQKEYNFTYEEGRITRAVESDVVLNESQMIVAKTIVHTLRYIYDQEGNLLRKHSVTADGTQQISYCENDANDCTMVKVQNGDYIFTSHSKTDSFGRKVFDELQLGTGTVSRQFLYHAGQATEEHTANGKIKSTPTTNLVSKIIQSDGWTQEYEYDEEERITKGVDSYYGTTEYTYDALGQLLTEKVNGRLVNAMTYDNYGNILTKNGVTYTYGDSVWKDKLTAVGDKTISYDAQGNPTSYLGHTLTWEKGRQLKSFDGNTYTYNANGIRTSKTINGVKHTYTLDGAKILRETWGDNVLIPLYDNEDSVCGILYNDKPYYFRKNLQGDVIAITNEDGQTVVEYDYDAWGVCFLAEDISGDNIDTINPFRYRGYYYDAEIDMYYLQSRYYDPIMGRFLNSDDAEILGVSLHTDHISGTDLFSYCGNAPVNDKDISGGLSEKQLAALLIPSSIFAMFMAQLYANLSKGLLAVGAHATKIITPVAIKALWWKPVLAAALIVAAVALVVAGVLLIYNAHIKAHEKAVAQAHAKIESIVKRSSKVRYWTATLRTDYVDIGRGITYSKAVTEVSAGRNVFAVTSAEAKAVAKAAYSNKKPVGPEIDKGKENTKGYYYHYHVYGRNKKGHVFFLFW